MLNGFAIEERELRNAFGSGDAGLLARAKKKLRALPQDRKAAADALVRLIEGTPLSGLSGHLCALALEAVCETVGERLALPDLDFSQLSQIEKRLRKAAPGTSVHDLFAKPRWPELPPIEELPLFGVSTGSSRAALVRKLDAAAEKLGGTAKARATRISGISTEQTYELVDPRSGARFRGKDSASGPAEWVVRAKARPPRQWKGSWRKLRDAINERIDKGWIWVDDKWNLPVASDPEAEALRRIASALKEAPGLVVLFLW